MTLEDRQVEDIFDDVPTDERRPEDLEEEFPDEEDFDFDDDEDEDVPEKKEGEEEEEKKEGEEGEEKKDEGEEKPEEPQATPEDLESEDDLPPEDLVEMEPLETLEPVETDDEVEGDSEEDEFEMMDRKALKRYIRSNDLPIVIYKKDSDDDLRWKIRKHINEDSEGEDLDSLMGDDVDVGVDFVKLKHFVYGSYKGYMMKAKTPDIDPEGDTEPFMGMLLPVSQADLKSVEDVRFLIPAGWNTIILSRVYAAGRDDKGRGTIANHSVFIPREHLEKGMYTYDDVMEQVVKFDKANPNILGEMKHLKVPITNNKPDFGELRNIISKSMVENIINKYKKNKDQRIFLKYSGSSRDQRIKCIYLLSMLLDIKLKVVPLAAFSDTPYTSAKAVFNFIIAREKIGIKPGGDWTMINVDSKAYDASSKKEEIKDALDDIYG